MPKKRIKSKVREREKLPADELNVFDLSPEGQ